MQAKQSGGDKNMEILAAFPEILVFLAFINMFVYLYILVLKLKTKLESKSVLEKSNCSTSTTKWRTYHTFAWQCLIHILDIN